MATSDFNAQSPKTMKTLIDNLRVRADEIAAGLVELERLSSVRDRELNRPGQFFHVITTTPYAWNKLAGDGAIVQRRLIDLVNRFAAIALTLVAGRPPTVKTEFDRALGRIRAVVEQEAGVANSSVHEPFEGARAALTTMIDSLCEAYPVVASEVMLIPDTNALLHNPAVEAWRFADLKQIRLILVPQVLAELDERKVRGGPGVKEKAERLIRQFKEYRRRGSLADGVPLTKGYSTIAAIALEPTFTDNLPWLRETNEDDQILATLVEVTRAYASNAVALVTRDFNLQNKAEVAGVPLVEPPDP